MEQKAIDKAFEGRWRLKVNSVISQHKEQEPVTYDVLRNLCRDFFEAGIIIAENVNQVSPVGFGTAEAQQAPVSDGSPSESSFESFWLSYDKKVGRSKCEKLWAKLSSKDKELCIQYVPLYVHAQPDKQFRKNPETFLRNKSWNDEIINRNPDDHQRQQTMQRLQQAAQVIASYEDESR